MGYPQMSTLATSEDSLQQPNAHPSHAAPLVWPRISRHPRLQLRQVHRADHSIRPFAKLSQSRIPLSCVYSAADVFVLPSFLDNLPNVALESISCGVPVAAFASGGIPDMVRPGVTGLLANTGDATELRNILRQLLQGDEMRAQMSVNCRRIAVQEYSLEVQAKRYADLYSRMVARVGA